MEMRNKIFGLLILWTLIIQPVAASSTSEVNIIPKTQEYWTCVDYSKDFAARNPDWSIVTLSSNQLFRGISHMVNYKFDPTHPDMLLIHDGRNHEDYTYCDWYKSPEYFHFWLNGETPVRTYIFLRDNRATMLKEYNITEQTLEQDENN